MDVLIAGGGRPYSDGDTFDHRAPLAFTLDDILDPIACTDLIARIEAAGPAAAPITTASGFVMAPHIRNNTRVVFDDPALADRLFARIAPHVPAQLCGMQAVGANERFRAYRYEPGQRFAPHRDGAFARTDRERSLLTFMVYLNDGFAGGDTAFHEHGVVARPHTGRALLFQHLLLHEGCTVTSGVKYVLRSDVMFAAARPRG